MAQLEGLSKLKRRLFPQNQHLPEVIPTIQEDLEREREILARYEVIEVIWILSRPLPLDLFSGNTS